jgi:hypothetical protein
MFLQDLKLDVPEPGSAIDSGAEEELFRDMGRRAAAEVLSRRWEDSDDKSVGLCPRCGNQLKDLGKRPKVVLTLCGPVKLRRQTGHCAHCHETTTELDKRLEIEDTGIAPGLQRIICRTALELAYEPSRELLRDTLGYELCSAREIERIACRHGEEIERLSEVISVGRSTSTKRKIYSLTIDGTMIPGRADPEKHRLVWHEIKLATVTDVRDIQAPFYVASTEKAEGFGLRLCKNLESMSITPHTLAQVVADGAPWIWNLADMHLPGVPQLLDFYHASEHLHHTAAALWSDETANKWWKERLEQLKTGKLDDFFAALKFIAKSSATSNTEASPERLLNYFETNRHRLGYAEALKCNLPIGSGAVESAGRHIVQQRLKQSGMRWSLAGAQAMLNLRTCHRNGFFESYWENRAA